MNVEWIRWEPIAGLAKKYYIYAIYDTVDGFKIELFEENDVKKRVDVIFENSVDAYRSTDESYRLKTIYNLDKYDKGEGRWTFFKVINSEYLKWLSDESYEISDSLSFIHFAFISIDCILDVVTNYEPKVIQYFDEKRLSETYELTNTTK